MKKISLKWKMILVGLIPSIGLFVFGALGVWDSYKKLSDASTVFSQISILDSVSPLVNLTQKERGASASYLSGGISADELVKRHKNTDQALSLLKQTVVKSNLGVDYQKKVLKLTQNYNEIRKKVIAKEYSVADAVKTYTGKVSAMIGLQSEVAEYARLSEVAYLSSAISSIRILEDAKEAGGKYRAKMTSIAAKDKSVPIELMKNVGELKSLLEASLKSSGIFWTEKGKSLSKQFYESSEWKYVQQTHSHVYVRKNEGGYGVNPKRFFEKISDALALVETWITEDRNLVKGLAYQAKQEAQSSLIWMLAKLLLVFAVLSIYLFKTVRSTNQNFNVASDSLSKGATSVTSISSYLNEASTNLTDSFTEQAAALTETVASLNQINSMVEKNMGSAQVAEKLSKDCKNASVGGAEAVKKVVDSVREIESGNKELIGHVSAVKTELNGIAKMVADIGEKTTVINDIVFQTKLLSFNASVEAARAGEHGRGFAVVAEEIGNLASMSGKAANEISSILSESIDRVNKVAKQSEVKSSDLEKMSKSKIATGIEYAGSCQTSFEGILTKITDLTSSVESIVQASKEQAAGFSEIHSAIRELDDSNQENTRTCAEVSEKAGLLDQQASGLSQSVEKVNHFVYGGNMQFVEGEAVDAPASNTLHIVKKEEKAQKIGHANNVFEHVISKAAGSDYVPSDDDQWEEV